MRMHEKSQQEWLKRLDECIRMHIGNFNLNIDEIARCVHISSRQLSRRCKIITGQTPNERIQQLRLEKAHELLSTYPKPTVSQVALQIGYKNQDYFSALFKSYFGYSPSKVLSK